MVTVNIHEAKTHLSRLVARALEGEDVVIAKRNRPLVKLVVCDEAKPQRTLGSAKGLVQIAADFDETPEDFADYV